MSSSARQSRKSSIARSRALHTHVYISGLKGHHTLETGLAYYYRGHYIYIYPAGNLIEPIQYSIRKGIMIQGIVSASAPVYDADKEGLVDESSVSALKASIQTETAALKQPSANKAAETDLQQDWESSSPASPAVPGSRSFTDALRPSLSSLPLLHENALPPSTPPHSALLLSASAPGSRLASRAASPSGLRPTSSHIGLARLGAIRGTLGPPDGFELETNPAAEDIPPRSSSVGFLVGLGDHALSAEDLPSVVARDGVRVPPCAIHGEECDGVATDRLWLSEEVRRGMGFVGEVPVVDCGGRVMVDWAGLLEEERARGGW